MPPCPIWYPALIHAGAHSRSSHLQTQVWPYRDSHPGTAARVLQRQSAFILHDVYANSYTEHWVAAQALRL